MKMLMMNKLMISTFVLAACGTKKSNDNVTTPPQTIRWTEEQKLEAKDFYQDSVTMTLPTASKETASEITNCLFKIIEERYDYNTWEHKIENEDLLSQDEIKTCYSSHLTSSKTENNKPQPVPTTDVVVPESQKPVEPVKPVDQWTLETKKEVYNKCYNLSYETYVTSNLKSMYCGCVEEKIVGSMKPSEYLSLDLKSDKFINIKNECEKTSRIVDAKEEYEKDQRILLDKKNGIQILPHKIYSSDQKIYADLELLSVGSFEVRDLTGNYLPSQVEFSISITTMMGPCNYSYTVFGFNLIGINANVFGFNIFSNTTICRASVQIMRKDTGRWAQTEISIEAIK